jgi:hypothetical protein
MALALAIPFVAGTTAAESGEVHVGVHIGVPAPLIVAPAPAIVVAPPPAIVVQPQIVAVPGTAVYHVPGVGFNVFVFGGTYYSHHHGHWFVSTGHRGTWRAIPADRVPRPVLAVPVAYYKIPPGHARKWRDHGKGSKHRNGKRGRDD